MIEVLEYKDIIREHWSTFVNAHPLGNIFQTPEMYDVYALTNNIRPIVVAAVEDGQIVGILLAQHITNGGKIASWLTARSIIIGGPIVRDNDPEIAKVLLEAHKKVLPKNTIYSEIRPIYDMESIMDERVKELRSWKRKGHYNLVLGLEKSQEELFEQMYKERRRNVNQAIKAGLIFREVSDIETIHAIVALIKQTYERKHVPISYLDIFDKVHQYMGKYAHFFACYTEDGTLIAGQVRLCYKELVYSWFAGSDEAYFKLRPNDFTMWNVICWSAENGYKLLDFGGGGEPGVEYGVRDYKLKYGCEMYDYGRYTYAHRPLTLWAGTIAYKLYHKIKGK